MVTASTEPWECVAFQSMTGEWGAKARAEPPTLVDGKRICPRFVYTPWLKTREEAIETLEVLITKF